MIDDSGKKSKLICCSTCLTLKIHVDPGVTARFIQSTRLRGPFSMRRCVKGLCLRGRTNNPSEEPSDELRIVCWIHLNENDKSTGINCLFNCLLCKFWNARDKIVIDALGGLFIFVPRY
jgi:hypothetical protein